MVIVTGGPGSVMVCERTFTLRAGYVMTDQRSATTSQSITVLTVPCPLAPAARPSWPVTPVGDHGPGGDGQGRAGKEGPVRVDHPDWGDSCRQGTSSLTPAGNHGPGRSSRHAATSSWSPGPCGMWRPAPTSPAGPGRYLLKDIDGGSQLLAIAGP